MDFILAATSLVPDRSAAFTVTVIIAGLGIVLATLALLIVIFSVFGLAVSSAQDRASKSARKRKNAIKHSSAVPEPPAIKVTEAPLPPAVAEGTPPEVVAAISAAVYMLEGEGAKVTAITRRRSPISARNPWAQAAITDNTRPF